jgi:alpha-L-fucosidase
MPEWFLDDKFGIFIHWGVYSVPAWGKVGEYAEWYWHFLRNDDPQAVGSREGLNHLWREFHHRVYGADFDYQDFAPRFQAELFDAREWAELFRRSGARYIVPTSKHHEGFALWPSAEASRTWGRPWNSVEIGPRRDLMHEMAEATRAAGLRFGFYYSLYEWFNPLWLQDRRRYIDEHMIPQFKDVVNRYQPSLVFSDGEWDLPSSEWKSEQLLAWLFNDSAAPKDVVINDRWGKETRHRHGGYWTTEYTPGLSDASHPWEESRGIAFSYGLNRAERAHHYKSADELILVLVDIVSRGGNLLLDIGPAADGTIPPLMEERLLAMGAWLERNGEAIYGTRSATRSAQWTQGERPEMAVGEFRVDYPLLEQVGQAPRQGRAVKQVFFTQKPSALYAITAGWPGRTLVLRDVRTSADTKVRLLGVEGDLPIQRGPGTLTIQLPDLSAEQLRPPAHALKITGAELLPE